MKCLMIKPEYVSEIMGGEKDEEYRSWSTNYRGEFLIGCSSTKQSNAFIAGVAFLKDVFFDEDNKIYVWVLDNIRAVKPIPIKGRLRLFESGIDTYEVISTDDEINAAYNEAEKWIVKGV